MLTLVIVGLAAFLSRPSLCPQGQDDRSIAPPQPIREGFHFGSDIAGRPADISRVDRKNVIEAMMAAIPLTSDPRWRHCKNSGDFLVAVKCWLDSHSFVCRFQSLSFQGDESEPCTVEPHKVQIANGMKSEQTSPLFPILKLYPIWFAMSSELHGRRDYANAAAASLSPRSTA